MCLVVGDVRAGCEQGAHIQYHIPYRFSNLFARAVDIYQGLGLSVSAVDAEQDDARIQWELQEQSYHQARNKEHCGEQAFEDDYDVITHYVTPGSGRS